MDRDPETYAVIGSAMEVHRQLGHGFLEAVYQAALASEFQERAIPFRAEVSLPIRYKGKLLSCGYRADFICFENLVVETKALGQLTGNDKAQLINELKATGFRLGLLINFGAPNLEYHRLAFDPALHLRKSAQSADQPSDFIL
jgi:GxxExxY protein